MKFSMRPLRIMTSRIMALSKTTPSIATLTHNNIQQTLNKVTFNIMPLSIKTLRIATYSSKTIRTFSISAIRIATFSTMTLSITAIRKMTFSIRTIGKMTFSTMTLSIMIIRKNGNQNNETD